MPNVAYEVGETPFLLIRVAGTTEDAPRHGFIHFEKVELDADKGLL